MTQLLPALHRSFSAVSRPLLAVAAFSLVSCFPAIKPEEAAVEVKGAKGPLAVSVADHRKDAGLIGTARNYGIYEGPAPFYFPSAVVDPAMPVSDGLAFQLPAGLKRQGIAASVIKTKRFETPGHPAPADRRTLTVRMDDVWIDFLHPYRDKGVLSFDATAQVLAPGGRVQATATRSFTRGISYDHNDGFSNQAVKILQPEFTQLVNDPAIRKALATP